MNKEKAFLRLEIQKTRFDAEVCAKHKNFYLANELEKRVSKLVKQYNAL